MLFFDERFNLISAADGGVHQQQVASSVGVGGASLSNLTGIKAPKNGYVYVYVSNQSNQDVYFDNLAVTIAQGNIIEENHYYAFCLKIAAISSKKFTDSYDGNTKNNYQMQGAFSEMDDDIGWNDFALRNYDPQIGRWVQIDPYADRYLTSPYVGMGNDPVNMIDPSGGNLFTGMSAFGRVATTTIIGAVAGAVASWVTGDESGRLVGIGALMGAMVGSPQLVITITGKTIQVANAASTVINTALTTSGIGNVPSYTIKDVIDYGRASATFSNLLTQAGVDDHNYSTIISFALPTDKYRTYTSGAGRISIDPLQSLEGNVIGLAHELTNKTLGLEFGLVAMKLINDVINLGKDRTVAIKEAATKFAEIENASLYNQFRVAKELHLKKMYSREMTRIYKKYKKGKMTDEQLKDYIDKHASVAADTGESIEDAYYKQFDEYLKPYEEQLKNPPMPPIDNK